MVNHTGAMLTVAPRITVVVEPPKAKDKGHPGGQVKEGKNFEVDRDQGEKKR